jgi:hypothetical protein
MPMQIIIHREDAHSKVCEVVFWTEVQSSSSGMVNRAIITSKIQVSGKTQVLVDSHQLFGEVQQQWDVANSKIGLSADSAHQQTNQGIPQPTEPMLHHTVCWSRLVQLSKRELEASVNGSRALFHNKEFKVYANG